MPSISGERSGMRVLLQVSSFGAAEATRNALIQGVKTALCLLRTPTPSRVAASRSEPNFSNFFQPWPFFLTSARSALSLEVSPNQLALLGFGGKKKHHI